MGTASQRFRIFFGLKILLGTNIRYRRHFQLGIRNQNYTNKQHNLEKQNNYRSIIKFKKTSII